MILISLFRGFNQTPRNPPPPKSPIPHSLATCLCTPTKMARPVTSTLKAVLVHSSQVFIPLQFYIFSQCAKLYKGLIYHSELCFLQAIDLGFDATAALGNLRSKRSALSLYNCDSWLVAISPSPSIFSFPFLFPPLCLSYYPFLSPIVLLSPLPFSSCSPLPPPLLFPLFLLISFRYSMIVDNGVVTGLNVEPDNVGLTCTLSNSLLNQL